LKYPDFQADMLMIAVTPEQKARRLRRDRAPADSGLEKVPGGAEGNRTPDLLIANEALYHLSYGPRKARNNPFEAAPVKRLSAAGTLATG
jgi:hypothetical protein